MTLHFYDCTIAPSPRRISMMIALKGLEIETTQIDIMKGEQLSDSFRAINPECTIPALKITGGTVLTNVAAIAAWLEATYPTPALFGETPNEKAEIAGWVSLIEQDLGMAVPNALRNSNPVFKDRALPGPVNYAQIPALAERGLQMMDVFFARLEAHLDGKEFIATNRVSFADITAVCFLDFCRVVGKKITDDYPNMKRWRKALAADPAFAFATGS